MHTVYLITNRINGNRYVGQTKMTLRRRWHGHCSGDKRKATYLFNAIQKYGKDNFSMEPLIEVESQDLANEFEAEYIVRYCTRTPNGYNLMTGGGLSKHSEESKRKLSVARLGKKLTELHKLNIRLAMQDSELRQKLSDYRKGKKLTEDHKRKIRDGVNRPEVLAKISMAMKGRTHTPETRAQLSRAHKGVPHPWNTKENRSWTDKPVGNYPL